MYSLSILVGHIDESIKVDLQALRDSYFGWLLVSSGVVALGVILEGPELVHETIGVIPRSSDRERKTPPWITWLALVGWLFVVLGVAGEGIAEALVSQADGLVQTFNDILLTDTQREIARAEERAGDAKISAADAADAAGRAKSSASKAESLARGARQEADSFEKDIVSAKTQAADAESHLADALQRAAAATAELDRIKSPRSLTNGAGLTSILEGYKDTEYTFSGVFGDEESINLLKTVDDILKKSGWKRVKPPHGFPAINVYGTNEDFAVPQALRTGIQISVDWPEDLSPELKALTPDKLPIPLKTAVFLNSVISSDLFPPEEHPPVVDVEKGKSKTIRISIGKKP